MEFDIRFTQSFLKHYQQISRNNKLLKMRVKKTINLLQTNPYYSGLKTHKIVSKDWGEVLSSRVSGDIRIIWSYDQGNRLILILLDVGGHSDIY